MEHFRLPYRDILQIPTTRRRRIVRLKLEQLRRSANRPVGAAPLR